MQPDVLSAILQECRVHSTSFAGGKGDGVEKAEIEATLATAAERLRLTEERLHELTDRLAKMDEEREAILGQAALTKQAIADYQQHHERLQQELADATRREEADAAFQQAVDARDVALDQASAAVAAVAAAFERLDAARQAAVQAHTHLQSVNPRARSMPPEPTDFHERWAAVAPLLQKELGVQLESELVEAAARSGNYLVVKNLPEHLRELASQRLREYQEARTAK
jgi:vacuolar-type H+-ATPase subunit I/STV1